MAGETMQTPTIGPIFPFLSKEAKNHKVVQRRK